jgi:hypothetical protein
MPDGDAILPRGTRRSVLHQVLESLQSLPGNSSLYERLDLVQ